MDTLPPIFDLGQFNICVNNEFKPAPEINNNLKIVLDELKHNIMKNFEREINRIISTHCKPFPQFDNEMGDKEINEIIVKENDNEKDNEKDNIKQNKIYKLSGKDIQRTVEISKYFHLPQHEAADLLGIPSSTLSKRWKEATVNRSWPHRPLLKIEKAISVLSQQKNDYVRDELTELLEKRKELTKPVFVRL